jgi:hypothetical protein
LVSRELVGHCRLVHIHSRKEIENFLLVPSVLERAVRSRLEDRQKRTGNAKSLTHDVAVVLSELADAMRRDVQSQCIAQFVRYERSVRRGVDDATLTSEALGLFEERWAHFDGRLATVSGKDLFAGFNAFLMEQYDISLSQGAVVRLFHKAEIPQEMVYLVDQIDEFGDTPITGT